MKMKNPGVKSYINYIQGHPLKTTSKEAPPPPLSKIKKNTKESFLMDTFAVYKPFQKCIYFLKFIFKIVMGKDVLRSSFFNDA